MASGGSWGNGITSNYCLDCKTPVEILNNDVRFSMELHMQSHKPLKTIAQEIDKQLREFQVGSKTNSKGNWYTCPDCKENVEILNNDVSLSLQLHAEKHNTSELCSDDQSSIYSGESKNSNSKINLKMEPKSQYMQSNIFDSIFNAMPPDLKSHRGFILEDDSGKVFCKICNVKIKSIFNVSEHLKTKLHEDNIILFLKNKLPVSSHQMLEFVSIYGSTLCCNLCRCKIELCSNNPFQTIVNIMIHNGVSSHLRKKSTNEYSRQSDDASVIINSLASINTLLNDNKVFIDCKMQPQFKCSLCDKNIIYDQNENQLLKNFVAHFTSKGHNQLQKAISVLKSFELSHFPGKNQHNFVLSKGTIYCTVCDCDVNANIEDLKLHIQNTNYIKPTKEEPLNFASNLEKLINLPGVQSNITPPILKQDSHKLKKGSILLPLASVVPEQEAMRENVIDVQVLVNSLPKQFKNIKYIIVDGQGQVHCLICDCKIPATTQNLKMHLLGKSHKKKEAGNSSFVVSNQGLPKLSLESQDTKHQLTYDQMFDTFMNTDSLIATNGKMFAKCKDGKHYMCTLCSGLIKASSNFDILKQKFYTHLRSCYHYIYRLENELPQVMLKDEKIPTVNELFDMLPSYLQKDIEFINAVSNNTVICLVCNVNISAHSKCLQEHLEGVLHTKSVMKLNQTVHEKTNFLSSNENVLLKKITETDKIMEKFSKFLLKKNDNFVCTLCNCIIGESSSEQKLKENIVSHVAGQKHTKNNDKLVDKMLKQLLLSDPVIETNKLFLEKQEGNLYCKLCACSMSVPPEKETLRKCLVQHFAGLRHIQNSKISVFTQGAFPVRPVISENISAVDPIRELFKELPANLQDDIFYIKNSSIEGYLACSICSAIINPHYLREHLEEGRHIQEKIVNRELFNQTSSHNKTENKKGIQNMGSLSSLLDNIDKKLSWPVKQ